MDTITLWRLALSDPMIKNDFGGVYAADELPKYIGSYGSYIVNLDPKNKPGSHWIALHFKNGTCYYFCSHGRKSGNILILKFIENNSNKIECNTLMYQKPTTSTCGLFSLFFLYCIVRGKKLSALSPHRLDNNERIVQLSVKNCLLLRKCLVNKRLMQSCTSQRTSQ